MSESNPNTSMLIGQTYGKLLVVAATPQCSDEVFWICECGCGKFRRVEEQRLISEQVTRCVTCEANLKMQRLAG